jgi:hypothetical protein
MYGMSLFCRRLHNLLYPSMHVFRLQSNSCPLGSSSRGHKQRSPREAYHVHVFLSLAPSKVGLHNLAH